jgi:hypothetical protein
MRRVAAVLALGAALLAGPPLAATATAAGHPPSPAIDVCESMVRGAIETSLGAPLPAPQQGVWTGRTYTCTYTLTGGQLVLRVDDLRTKKKARAAYAKLWKAAAGSRTRLNGLGNAAYQAGDGTLVAVKDQFLLVADPAAVPAPIKKSDLAFAAVVSVMSCWTAGS